MRVNSDNLKRIILATQVDRSDAISHLAVSFGCHYRLDDALFIQMNAQRTAFFLNALL